MNVVLVRFLCGANLAAYSRSYKNIPCCRSGHLVTQPQGRQTSVKNVGLRIYRSYVLCKKRTAVDPLAYVHVPTSMLP